MTLPSSNLTETAAALKASGGIFLDALRGTCSRSSGPGASLRCFRIVDVMLCLLPPRNGQWSISKPKFRTSRQLFGLSGLDTTASKRSHSERAHAERAGLGMCLMECFQCGG